MRRSLREIESGRYRLRKAVWKFDSLVLDEGTVLGEKELAKLDQWDIPRVDVEPLPDAAAEAIETDTASVSLLTGLFRQMPPSETGPLPGVSDGVDPRSLEILQQGKLQALATLEDLEKIDFQIDESRCCTPDDLYLADAVVLPDTYSLNDARASGRDAERFLAGAWLGLGEDRPFDLQALKILVTLKIQELERFGEAILDPLFATEPHPENYLARHSLQVMLLVLALGRRLGLKENHLAEVGLAAVVHDAGMARLAGERWLVRKKFNFNDYFEIFKHPILGVDFLTLGLVSRLGGLVTLAVYQHHERLDGSGYPKGRKGVGVSAHARLLGVCDVFEAMISDRPWRRRVSALEAFRFIASHAGILFDRAIVDALFSLLADRQILSGDPPDMSREGERPVFIADTSPYNLWYICNLLRTHRIPVYAARSQDDLLTATYQQTPRVLLVDASISERHGLDVLQILREREDLQGIPVIYSSNSGNKTDVVQAIQIGIQDYLKKPYTFDFVVNRLAKFLR